MNRRARRRRSVDSYTQPRQGYGSTVNRPSFRPQAPAVAFDLPFLRYPAPVRAGLSPLSRARGPRRDARRPVNLGVTPNSPKLYGAFSSFSFPSAPFKTPIGPILIDQWLGDRIPAPAGSTICQKRRVRRAVIFAGGHTGAGAGAKRKHTIQSSIHCGGHS